ncbi:MAG: hypothetical protein LUD72_03245, partial [Bacteroidales bacterium]|nr:hypothetical protein [Bacteroidales bacterium]
MKNKAKKIALIFSSVILAVCLALNVVACVVSGDGSISEESSSDQTDPEINEGDSQYPSSDDTEETDDKIVNVEVNNLDVYYLTTSTIDFDAVTLTVAFDDGSTEVLTEKEYDIDDKDAAENTEFILGTDGLYDAVKEAEAKGEELEK